MVRGKQWGFFGPEILVFGRKIQFLPYYPNFGPRPVCSPWRDRSFTTLGTIFRLSVPELEPFFTTRFMIILPLMNHNVTKILRGYRMHVAGAQIYYMNHQINSFQNMCDML